MADRAQNLQDTFLNHVRKNKTPLTIFLVNGVKLQGIVTWFDNFCVLLRRDGHSQLVYKHAISTIMPGTPVQLFEPSEEVGRSGERLSDNIGVVNEADGAGPTGAAPTRALVLVPVVRGHGQGRAHEREPQARVDEAVGLAQAIDLDVVDGLAVPLVILPAGNALRERQGRGTRPARRR